MSAPRTPAEMADWLRGFAVAQSCFGQHHPQLFAIAAWIRRQPTDAQKIEALTLALEQGMYGDTATPAKALRLLGLPTE